MQLQDHQVEIWQYTRDLENEIGGKLDLYDWIGEQLELKIWRADDGIGWKAEILLSFGGPTVSISLDSRWEYGTLHHSWGAKANGEAQTSTEFYSRALHEAVNDMAEAGVE